MCLPSIHYRLPQEDKCLENRGDQVYKNYTFIYCACVCVCGQAFAFVCVCVCGQPFAFVCVCVGGRGSVCVSEILIIL